MVGTHLRGPQLAVLQQQRGHKDVVQHERLLGLGTGPGVAFAALRRGVRVKQLQGRLHCIHLWDDFSMSFHLQDDASMSTF